MNSKISKTPREVVQELDQFIVGQASAKRALAVAVYNHYKRVSYTERSDDDVDLQKSNILIQREIKYQQENPCLQEIF